MTREEKYDLVNSCETPEQLQQVIITFADENGEIQGRDQKWNAVKMAELAGGYFKGFLPPNVITREFGLRQQAMYIKYYN